MIWRAAFSYLWQPFIRYRFRRFWVVTTERTGRRPSFRRNVFSHNVFGLPETSGRRRADGADRDVYPGGWRAIGSAAVGR